MATGRPEWMIMVTQVHAERVRHHDSKPVFLENP